MFVICSCIAERTFRGLSDQVEKKKTIVLSYFLVFQLRGKPCLTRFAIVSFVYVIEDIPYTGNATQGHLEKCQKRSVVKSFTPRLPLPEYLLKSVVTVESQPY